MTWDEKVRLWTTVKQLEARVELVEAQSRSNAERLCPVETTTQTNDSVLRKLTGVVDGLLKEVFASA